MAGLPIDRRRALEIVILYLATRPDGLDDVLERIIKYITDHPTEFNRFLSQYYYGHPNAVMEQDMFFPEEIWDMLSDTAQRIVFHLTDTRDSQ